MTRSGYYHDDCKVEHLTQFLRKYPLAVLHCDQGVFSAIYYQNGELFRYCSLGRSANPVKTYYRLRELIGTYPREIGSGKKAA